MKVPGSGWFREYVMATLDSVLGSLVNFDQMMVTRVRLGVNNI